METPYVYLVPGFFGFSSLGDLPYFPHVEAQLRAALAARGLDAQIITVQTRPTASLPHRAARLAETIAKTAPLNAPLHLIGHSTGGLDARMLVSPATTLPTDAPVDRIARRVKSVVCISTPHHGTPLASFFNTLPGQQLLRGISVLGLSTLKRGGRPIAALLKVTAQLLRPNPNRINPTVLTQAYDHLLADFSESRRASLEQYLQEIRNDQALVIQLTPDGMEVFNATTRDRRTTRYGAVLSLGAPPELETPLSLGADLYGQATHALYATLHKLSTGGATPDARAALLDALLGPGAESFSDGIVPTHSQLWGDTICAVRGDHLDLVGHFGDLQGEIPTVDWLASGSGFTWQDFEDVWDRISQFLCQGAPLNPPAPELLSPPEPSARRTWARRIALFATLIAGLVTVVFVGPLLGALLSAIGFFAGMIVGIALAVLLCLVLPLKLVKSALRDPGPRQ